MIEKHIINIGLPRCGTSWLWHHARFDPVSDKENSILLNSLDFDRYLDHYKNYKISANFNPNLWCVDRDIIQFVLQHSSHVSIILRNPFEFVGRFYDWIVKSPNKEELVRYIITAGYIKYYDIVQRWQPGAHKFKIFFFEDLEADPAKFFQDYVSFCDLPQLYTESNNYNVKINSNTTVKTTIEFSQYEIDYINQEIDKFQTLTQRNLDHWKR